MERHYRKHCIAGLSWIGYASENHARLVIQLNNLDLGLLGIPTQESANLRGFFQAFFVFYGENQMKLILKSHDLHIALDANNATDIIKIKALAEMLEISYPALKQRLFRGQNVDTAIRELLAKGGE